MKQIKDLKPVLHLKKDNYIYRYVLVDRFQNDGKNHYGFDTKQEKTTEEIFALKSNRQIRRKYARLCNARYSEVRDAVFRSHPWNCLQKRVEVSSSVTVPAWGFSYQYDLPGDCLRLLRILEYDSDHKVEGRSILSNSETMKILYISRVTDPNQYDELLRETLSSALGADIAYAITSNNTTSQNMITSYQEKLRDARFVDSTEGYNVNPDNGMTDVVGADTFINSRY
jgi:hypothetical protein